MVRKNWPEVTPPVTNDDHRIYVCTPMLMFDWMGGGHHHLAGIPLKACLQELILTFFNQGVLMKSLDQRYKHDSTATVFHMWAMYVKHLLNLHHLWCHDQYHNMQYTITMLLSTL